MSDLLTKLKYTLDAVDDIYKALKEKGSDITSTDELAIYGNKIRALNNDVQKLQDLIKISMVTDLNKAEIIDYSKLLNLTLDMVQNRFTVDIKIGSINSIPIEELGPKIITLEIPTDNITIKPRIIINGKIPIEPQEISLIMDILSIQINNFIDKLEGIINPSTRNLTIIVNTPVNINSKIYRSTMKTKNISLNYITDLNIIMNIKKETVQ